MWSNNKIIRVGTDGLKNRQRDYTQIDVITNKQNGGQMNGQRDEQI